MIAMWLLDTAYQNARYAARLLWRAKAFTTAAVSTLALGIAATTVMFALIQGVLLRPLPVQEQDRLVLAWREARTAGSAQYPFGNIEIEAIARESQLLESAAGVTRNGVRRSVVTDGSTSSYANVGLITGGFFEVLGHRLCWDAGSRSPTIAPVRSLPPSSATATGSVTSGARRTSSAVESRSANSRASSSA